MVFPHIRSSVIPTPILTKFSADMLARKGVHIPDLKEIFSAISRVQVAKMSDFIFYFLQYQSACFYHHLVKHSTAFYCYPPTQDFSTTLYIRDHKGFHLLRKNMLTRNQHHNTFMVPWQYWLDTKSAFSIWPETLATNLLFGEIFY